MDANPRRVGVIGATSLVGRSLLSLLVSGGYEVRAYSRKGFVGEPVAGIEWRKLPVSSKAKEGQSQPIDISISCWICVAPIWVLPEYFSLLEAHGVRRIVAISSTSRFTKSGSPDLREKETAKMLTEAEGALRVWAELNGVDWLILRPTLIYGLGLDKNISVIAQFIRRLRFFPLVGNAQGLRQPVHVADVATAGRIALENIEIANRAYTISGGETLSYREMVERVFAVLGRPVRLISVPVWFFRASIFLLRVFPRYRHLTASMAMRMNQDLVFDNSDAERDLSYRPRPFRLSEGDVISRGHTSCEMDAG